jgi:hypothetical protein
VINPNRFNAFLFSIALLGLVFALIIQEFNATSLAPNDPFRYGMIYTADEPSYLIPVRNWMENGTWQDNTEGNGKYFQRPPGYGLIYGFCTILLDDHAFLGLKLIHLVVYFFSIVLIGRILRTLMKKDGPALLGTTLFAIMPMFHGFMYYPLTEGVTPFLVLLFLDRVLKEKDRFDYVLLLVTVIILIVRPQLVVLPLLFFVYFLLKNKRIYAATLLLAAVPFLLWSIRTFAIEGEWKGLHPIYSKTNVTLFRPSHEKLTQLFRIWEYDGERFHSVVGGLKKATSEQDYEKIMDDVPPRFHREIKPILRDYKTLLEHPSYGRSKEFGVLEDTFIEETERVRMELVKTNRFQHHVITPLKSAFYLLTKSQMNLYVFQATWRGNWLVESLRVFSILLINLGFIAAFWTVFKAKDNRLYVLSISVLLYFFYLIYFQRMNEERYLTPWLPVLFLLLTVQLEQFYRWIKSRKDSLQ